MIDPESGRQRAETGRVTAERNRVRAELGPERGRVAAERGRTTAETARESAERHRDRTMSVVRALMVVLVLLALTTGAALFVALGASSDAQSVSGRTRGLVRDVARNQRTIFSVIHPTRAQYGAELERAIRELSRRQRAELYCSLRAAVRVATGRYCPKLR